MQTSDDISCWSRRLGSSRAEGDVPENRTDSAPVNRTPNYQWTESKVNRWKLKRINKLKANLFTWANAVGRLGRGMYSWRNRSAETGNLKHTIHSQYVRMPLVESRNKICEAAKTTWCDKPTARMQETPSTHCAAEQETPRRRPCLQRFRRGIAMTEESVTGGVGITQP